MLDHYISLENILYQYGKTGFKIEDLYLKLHTGQITALTGHNGSGKSTLTKLIMGILKNEKGEIFVNDIPAKERKLSDTAKLIGYLFQQPERLLFCDTVYDEIMFSLDQVMTDPIKKKERVDELMNRFGLSEKAKEYPLKLSVGQKQRLAFACLIAMDAPYYILDEPTSGLDQENKQLILDVIQTLKANGVGILLITHDAEVLGCSDRIITMSDGRMVCDENT